MSESCKYKCYIWELPVRWCHWINVVSIVTLAATGYLIGNPYSLGSSASDFAMGWIRFVHFTAAYLFTVSLASRVLWSFLGNKYAGWREFFPFATSRGREKMVKMLRYYMLIDKEVPETFPSFSIIDHRTFTWLSSVPFIGMFFFFLVEMTACDRVFSISNRAPRT